MERREVQGELRRIGQSLDHGRDREHIWAIRCPTPRPAKIEEVDFNPQYITAIAKFVDLEAIRRSGYNFLIDCMYGCGRGVIAGIFTRAGIPFVEIRSELNPLFPGINPEPILPHIRASQLAVVAEKCDAGFITDGDADRIGAVDEHGNVVDAHKVFAVLLYWLLTRKGWPGDVTRAFNTTKMIDRMRRSTGARCMNTASALSTSAT